MRVWHRFSSIVAAVWITASLTAAAHAEPLRIFYFDWEGFGPFFLAEEKGFFAKEDLKVQLIPVADTPAAYAGLSSGHVDAIAAAFQDIPFFWTPDDELVCVLALDGPIGLDGIVAHKDIETVSDLEGRTVAFEEGSTTHFYLNVVLRQAGLSQEDVEAVEVPDIDAVTAFLLGEVDAISTWMIVQALEAPHAHLLTDSSEQPGIIVGCLITTRERLEERKAAFRALGRAWDDAVDYVESHPNEAIEIMAARIGGARGNSKVFAETLEKITFYDRERNVAYFGTSGQPGQAYETAQTAIDVWTSVGVLDFELTPADIIKHDVWEE